MKITLFLSVILHKNALLVYYFMKFLSTLEHTIKHCTTK